MMNLDELKFGTHGRAYRKAFWVVVVAFLVVVGFYLSEYRHTNKLYDVIDRAHVIANGCFADGQAQIDTLAAEINAVLFLSRPDNVRTVNGGG